MRIVSAARALSVGALCWLCTQPAIAAELAVPRTAPVVEAPVAAPPVAASCYRFLLPEWSWYDYCWAERNPVAWRRPLRVRG